MGVNPIGKGPLTANYTIDGEKPQTSSVPTPSQNASLNFQTFFLSDTLNMGKHTIIIEVLETGVDRNYTFNQFQVTTPANGTDKGMNMSTNGSGGTSGSGSGSGGGGGNGSGGQSEGGSNNEGSNGDGSKGGDSPPGSSGETTVNPNTVAIVGGILGSVIFLILVIFSIFLFWRRRRFARISNGGQNRLPPMMYYAQPMPDGAPSGKLITENSYSYLCCWFYRARGIRGWTRLVRRHRLEIYISSPQAGCRWVAAVMGIN